MLSDHVIPHNARYACNPPDLDKWLAANEDEMISIQHNKVMTHVFSYLHDCAIAVTTMFIYVMMWTLEKGDTHLTHTTHFACQYSQMIPLYLA